tara:strand:- start:582 stop:1070 length:489 start_codon:yes stop_codon:yes gene_type:complete
MNAFQMIDSNRIATPKQTYGVACHFANIHASSPSERYGLTKVFNAVINKFYGDQDSHMTHGEVTDFREHQVVPVQFLELIRKPKAAKKVKPKAVKKVKPKAQTVEQAEIALDVKKPKAAKKVTPINSVAKQMDARLNAVEAAQRKQDIKLDAIIEALQALKS